MLRCFLRRAASLTRRFRFSDRSDVIMVSCARIILKHRLLLSTESPLCLLTPATLRVAPLYSPHPPLRRHDEDRVSLHRCRLLHRRALLKGGGILIVFAGASEYSHEHRSVLAACVKAAQLEGPRPPLPYRAPRNSDSGSARRAPAHSKHAELRSEFLNQISDLQEAY